jgi:hypothetical protein
MSVQQLARELLAPKVNTVPGAQVNNASLTALKGP